MNVEAMVEKWIISNAKVQEFAAEYQASFHSAMAEIERLKEELAQVYASKDLYRRKFWEAFKEVQELKAELEKCNDDSDSDEGRFHLQDDGSFAWE